MAQILTSIGNDISRSANVEPNNVYKSFGNLFGETKAKVNLLRDAVQENPITTLATIFAAGMVAAALFSRKAS